MPAQMSFYFGDAIKKKRPRVKPVAPPAAPVAAPVAPPAAPVARSPAPAPIWTPELQAQIDAQRLADSQAQGARNIASRFARFNVAEAARATAQAQSQMMNRAGRLAVAVPLATGAWETGKALKDRIAAGERFFPAAGHTVADNVVQSVRRTADSLITPGLRDLEQITGKVAPAVVPAAPAAPVAQPAPVAAPREPPRSPAAAAIGDLPPVAGGAARSRDPSSVLEAAPITAPAAPPRDPPSILEAVPASTRFLTTNTPITGNKAARTYTALGADAPVGTATGAAPAGRIGGFVGSSTDAEAARNVQAAAEQAAAAQGNIARMTVAADAQRDLRAAKLGVSRDVLDQVEGRAGAPAVSPTAPSPSSVFEQRGDSFGDAEMRRQGILSDLNSTSAKRRNAAAARLAGLQADAASRNAMGASAYQAQIESQIGSQSKKLDAETKRAELEAQLRSDALKERGLDRRTALAQQAANDRALLGAKVNAARIDMDAERSATARGLTAQEKRDDRAARLFDQGTQIVEDAVSPKGDRPPEIDRTTYSRFVAGLDTAKLAEYIGGSMEDAKRIKAGRTTPDEAQKLLALAKGWVAAQPGWLASKFVQAPSPSSILMGQ